MMKWNPGYDGGRLIEILDHGQRTRKWFAELAGLSSMEMTMLLAEELAIDDVQEHAIRAVLGGIAWAYFTCELPGPGEWPYRLLDSKVTNGTYSCTPAWTTEAQA